jgi:F-box-like
LPTEWEHFTERISPLLQSVAYTFVMSPFSNNKRKRTKTSGAKLASANQGVELKANDNAQTMAESLPSLIPTAATNKSRGAKSLLQAFGLLQAELQHQTNIMAQGSFGKGLQSDLLLAGVSISREVLGNVLDFLPAYDIVHRASLVCSSWLVVARSPQRWHTLNSDYGLKETTWKTTNMTRLLELLNLPQFASLKSLTSPDQVRLRPKALQQIAKACPLLETIDVGYSLWSRMSITDEDLQTLPSLFPHLKAVLFNTYNVTDLGMLSFCENMGHRLVSIRIQSRDGHNSPSDRTLKKIAVHCSNLEHFDYYTHSYQPCNFTHEGISALLKNCRKLRHLSLVRTPSVGKAAFEHIADAGELALERLFVVGNEELIKDRKLCVKLMQKIAFFEAIDGSVLTGRIASARVASQRCIDW